MFASSCSLSMYISKEPVIQNRGTLAENIGIAVTKVFSCADSAIYFCYKQINDWVIAPIVNYGVRPVCNAISRIFDLIHRGISTITTPICRAVAYAFDCTVKWVIRPIASPLCNAISNVFNCAVRAISTTAATLHRWVISPITTPLCSAISKAFDCAFDTFHKWVIVPLAIPLGNTVASIFNWVINRPFSYIDEHALKPALEVFSDLVNGMYRAAVIEKECSREELEKSLEQFGIADRPLATKNDLLTLLAEILPAKKYKAANCAIALYLNKVHARVIDQKWLEENHINLNLKEMIHNLHCN